MSINPKLWDNVWKNRLIKNLLHDYWEINMTERSKNVTFTTVMAGQSKKQDWEEHFDLFKPLYLMDQ